MQYFEFSNKAQAAAYQVAWAQYFRELEKGWDVVLPPEEQAPLTLDRTAVSMATNWAIDYLVTDALLDKVIAIAKEKKSPPVLIAIADTAPWFDHPDLQKFSWNELAMDFVGRGTKLDLNGHGTHCAGVGVCNSNIHRVGMVRKLAEAGLIRVVPVGVLNDNGSGSYAWIAQGCGYGVDLQKKAPNWRVITSLSLGGTRDDEKIRQAIDLAISKGVFFSASAGNNGGDGSTSTMSFPGCYGSVQAVGAIDRNGERANFSSCGNTTDRRVWVGTPGVDIWSTYRNGGYASLSGTSMANPISAFLDACLLLMYPEIGNQAELKQFKANHAKDLINPGYDVFTGFGLPKLENYFDRKPDKINPPATGPKPEPKPQPVRTERTLDVPVKGLYSTWWKPNGGGKYQEIFLGFELDFKTKLYAEDAIKAITDKLQSFFKASAYVLLPDDDLNEAIYWIRHFTEKILKEQGFDVFVTLLKGSDNAGNLLQLRGDDRRPATGLEIQKRGDVFFTKLKRGEVARLQINI